MWLYSNIIPIHIIILMWVSLWLLGHCVTIMVVHRKKPVPKGLYLTAISGLTISLITLVVRVPLVLKAFYQTGSKEFMVKFAFAECVFLIIYSLMLGSWSIQNIPVLGGISLIIPLIMIGWYFKILNTKISSTLLNENDAPNIIGDVIETVGYSSLSTLSIKQYHGGRGEPLYAIYKRSSSSTTTENLCLNYLKVIPYNIQSLTTIFSNKTAEYTVVEITTTVPRSTYLEFIVMGCHKIRYNLNEIAKFTKYIQMIESKLQNDIIKAYLFRYKYNRSIFFYEHIVSTQINYLNEIKFDPDSFTLLNYNKDSNPAGLNLELGLVSDFKEIVSKFKPTEYMEKKLTDDEIKNELGIILWDIMKRRAKQVDDDIKQNVQLNVSKIWDKISPST